MTWLPTPNLNDIKLSSIPSLGISVRRAAWSLRNYDWQKLGTTLSSVEVKTTLPCPCSRITNQLVRHWGGRGSPLPEPDEAFPGSEPSEFEADLRTAFLSYCILSIFKTPSYNYCDVAFNYSSLCFHCKLCQGKHMPTGPFIASLSECFPSPKTADLPEWVVSGQGFYPKLVSS